MRRQTLFFFLAAGVVATMSGIADEAASSGAQEEPAAPAGLRVKLSEGAEAATAPPARPAEAKPLATDEVRRVLDRLSPIAAAAEDAKEFAFPEKTLPPPRTGKTVTEPFPPPERPEAPAAPAAAPLEVVRYAPEGEVPLAPHLSLTFSQPMVPVTAHGDLAADAPPAKLEPEPPGAWRWIGTRTLFFEPRPRFPMATSYRVEVPAGTASAIGGKLEKVFRFEFATPPPKLLASYPTSGPHPLDPLLFAAFDQRIDPAAVLATIRVRAGGEGRALRLATRDEVEADPAVRALARAQQPGRWLAARLERPLVPGVHVTVAVGPGAPSLEGPRKTTSAEEWTFWTYGPLKIVETRCGWGGECRPLMPWFIRFSNPLDRKAKPALKVEPALEGLKVAIQGTEIEIQGRSRARTRYEVTIPASVRDHFGQTLGRDETVTFDVGPAPQVFGAPGEGFVVLDPAAPPRFSVYSMNHKKLKVRIHAVGPEDWAAFQAYMREQDPESMLDPPGREVVSETVKVEGDPDEFAETRIDLSPALKDGLGQAIVVIEPTERPKEPWQQSILRAWVQATRIGLDAFSDATELTGWASALADGRPLEGVALEIVPGGPSARTGKDGLAVLPLPRWGEASALLVARKGADVAILPESTSFWGGGGEWRRREPGDALRWCVFDDRHLYRPGETVRVKGWVRRVGLGKGGDLGPLDPADLGGKLTYKVTDSRGNEVGAGERPLDALGGFDLALELPKPMNLGSASVTFDLVKGKETQDRQYWHWFEVQEFRRPEFEVSAAASEGPHLVGGHADVSVQARYYAGGGLPNAEVTWQVSSRAGHFTPPDRGDFVFGTFVPWWFGESHDFEAESTSTYSGRTDASGKHVLGIDFESVRPPRPTSVRAEASVMDVNRQAWTAGVDLLVHPAALYVGLRSARAFVEAGKPIDVDAIVTDLDGKAIAGRTIALRAVRLDWEQDEDGVWREKEAAPQQRRLDSAAEAVRATFEASEGGVYRIAASIEDEARRRNESELRIWVAGGKQPPRREGVEQEQATLIPDRRTYRPGEQAEILVQAPFSPAEGVLTLRRSGIVATHRFTMAGPSHTLRVPIVEGHVPNVHVQVNLVGAAPRAGGDGKPDARLPGRPAFAVGSLDLPVPPIERTLALEARPRKAEIEPGGETVVDLRLRDAAGKPVAGAEIAVAVVDEAVLALTGYSFPDPIAVFYAPREAGASDYHLRSSIVLERPEDLLAGATGAGARPGLAQARMKGMPPGAAPAPALEGVAFKEKAAGGKDGGAAAPIRVRARFDPLAAFAPALPTDQDGHAEIAVKLPDTLTRYRIMAIAVEGGRRFGSGESTITARLPLMVRPSPPRFLNFGDRFELPIVLQNQTEEALAVDLAVRAANATLTAGEGRRVTVPARDRVEVRFPAAAARAGTARFQAGAAGHPLLRNGSGAWVDAAEFALPVFTPATAEAFATYGVIDQGAAIQPVRSPGGVIAGFGGLEVTTSSTALQALTDAVLYLVAYPFECSEQLASRVLAVAALRDVLAAFDAEGLPPPKEIEAAVRRDLERLEGMRNQDGGFGFWRRGDESWPYLSIHVAHALGRARAKGFEVDERMIGRSREYLQEIRKHIPGYYGEDARRMLEAYALYARKQMGDPDPERARALLAEAKMEAWPLEGLGFLLPVLADGPAARGEVAAIVRHLGNRVAETAGAAHFVTSYEDGERLLLQSDRRADGVILEGLIAASPRSDLIPKLVAGLLAHRKAGRWGNTQENAFVLLALDRYFATYEKETPDFLARVWLGERYAGGHRFKGRTTERARIEIPMRALAAAAAAGPQDLILAKEGPGRLYYRVGMRHAPESLKLDPADHGFTVTRAYEAVERPEDVRRDPDGTYRVRAGASVRVRLTMVAPARRYHVALVDPVPAGLEPLNPALAVTGTVPRDPSEARRGRFWWWFGPWYEHQNLRDERVEAFTSLLWDGVYTYTYVARATTPGSFIVPPPRAEEMYSPETFGRGGTDRVVVE